MPYTAFRFEDANGEDIYTFPRLEFEHEMNQPIASALSPVTGADYAFDFYQLLPGPKGVASESVRFIIVADTDEDAEDEIDTLRANLYEAGRGKLFVRNANKNTLRWAWARVNEIPRMTFGVGNRGYVPVVTNFARLSDWFQEDEVIHTEVISSTPHNFQVDNPGNARAYAMTIELRSKSASGFTDPDLLNETNGYRFQSTRDGTSVNDILRADTEGEPRVRYSSTNGASYADDYDKVTLGAQQRGIMALNAGTNNFVYTDGGSPDVDIVITFKAPFH